MGGSSHESSYPSPESYGSNLSIRGSCSPSILERAINTTNSSSNATSPASSYGPPYGNAMEICTMMQKEDSRMKVESPKQQDEEPGAISQKMDLTTILNPPEDNKETSKTQRQSLPPCRPRKLLPLQTASTRLPPMRLHPSETEREQPTHALAEYRVELGKVMHQDEHLYRQQIITSSLSPPSHSPVEDNRPLHTFETTTREPRLLPLSPIRRSARRGRTRNGVAERRIQQLQYHLPTNTSPIHKHTSPVHHAPSPSNPKPKRGPHSNIKYEESERDFIRFQRCDLKRNWKDVLNTLHDEFPQSRNLRDSVDCVNSIHYRDNVNPMIDPATGEQLRDEEGMLRWHELKARSQGKMRGLDGEVLPWRLVDKHPERAVGYRWVPEEWKRVARKNLVVARLKKARWESLRLQHEAAAHGSTSISSSTSAPTSPLNPVSPHNTPAPSQNQLTLLPFSSLHISVGTDAGDKNANSQK